MCVCVCVCAERVCDYRFMAEWVKRTVTVMDAHVHTMYLVCSGRRIQIGHIKHCYNAIHMLSILQTGVFKKFQLSIRYNTLQVQKRKV